MSDTAPLQLACRFCRPLVEGCPSVFEITLTSSVPEPVRDIVIEFRCAGLRGGVAERTLTKPLTAFEVLTLDMDIDPERKGTPPMTVHLHASTSRGRFTAHGSVRPGGQSGISILERPADARNLTVHFQENAFKNALFAEGGIDIGKVKSLNDFLQFHLPVPMEPVALSWDSIQEEKAKSSTALQTAPSSRSLTVVAVLAIVSLGAWIILSTQKEIIKEVPKLVEDTASKQEAEQQRQRADEMEKKAKEEQQKRLAAEIATAKAKAEADAARKASMSPPAPPNPPDAGSVGQVYEVTLPGAVEMSLCYCPAGSFTMGSPVGEDSRSDDEEQEKVTLTQPFWLAKTELTQAQWVALMRSNPSNFKGDDLPVEGVSAVDADAFITKLNEKVPLAGWKWVLPSEAQWEYACRAGSPGEWGWVSKSQMGTLADMGWFDYNSGGMTQEVGTKKANANAWGLYDMHGNVYEWCRDSWDGSAKLLGGTDPVGTTGSYRVFRGGSWDYDAQFCRAADRSGFIATYWSDYRGFLPAAVPARTERGME
jgi:formylglycine-generating enzyme required for sulfatase activity